MQTNLSSNFIIYYVEIDTVCISGIIICGFTVTKINIFIIHSLNYSTAGHAFVWANHDDTVLDNNTLNKILEYLQIPALKIHIKYLFLIIYYKKKPSYPKSTACPFILLRRSTGFW